MMDEAPLKQFDEAVEAMEKKIAGMKDRGYLPDYLNRLKDKRGELVYALEHEDDALAAEIIDLAISFGKEVNSIKSKKPSPLGFLNGLVPKPKKKVVSSKPKNEKKAVVAKAVSKKRVVSSPRKEKAAAKKEVAISSKQYEKELSKVAKELASRDVEIKGLKGAYAEMAAEMGEMRRRMEAKEARDVTELSTQIAGLKSSMDSLHSTMSKEFASSKGAYAGFGYELIALAVKVAELEDLIERGDTVSEVDVLQLNQAVTSLEKRLSLVEAQEKKSRLEMLEKVRREQKKMLKALRSKADTKKVVKTIKQQAVELRHELEEQDARVAAEMHVELKSSYYTLGQKLKKIEKELGKAKGKKDLEKVKERVAELDKHIQDMREGELGLEREMEQQQLSDRALMQRIEAIADRVRRFDEMDKLAISDLYKTIDALEAQVEMSSADARKVKSMVLALKSVKKELEGIDGEAYQADNPAKKKKAKAGKKKARGETAPGAASPPKKPAKKRAKKTAKKKKAAAAKKKPAKKKAVKKKPAKAKKKVGEPAKKKKKRLFGLLGG